MSLRYRLLAAVIGTNVAILVATFLTVVFEHEERASAHREYRKRFTDDIIEWAHQTWRGRGSWQRVLVEHVVRFDPNRGRENLHGSPLPNDQLDQAFEKIQAARRDGVAARVGSFDHGDRGWLVVFVPSGRRSPDGERTDPDALYLEAIYPPLPGSTAGLRTIYVAMMIGTVALMVVTYVLVSRWILAPIDRLVAGANRITAGNYSEAVDPTGREDEIETLIDAFNAMMIEVQSYRQHLEERVQDARRKMKLAEKNLNTAQRLAATGKLAAGIAHEVNNPLGGMLNAVHRLRSGTLSDDRRAQYFDVITDGLERIRELISKIRMFTPHRVKPAESDLAEIIDRALSLAAHRIEEQSCVVRVDVPRGELIVFGDPYELQQVFLNLLINALDSVGRTDREGDVEVVGSVVEEDDEVSVRVTDNGQGMDEAQIAQIFDLFFTTKEVGEGTGLGLSIVHNIVENHGGRILVEATPGRSATFDVRLPRIGDREDAAG